MEWSPQQHRSQIPPPTHTHRRATALLNKRALLVLAAGVLSSHQSFLDPRMSEGRRGVVDDMGLLMVAHDAAVHSGTLNE